MEIEGEGPEKKEDHLGGVVYPNGQGKDLLILQSKTS